MRPRVSILTSLSALRNITICQQNCHKIMIVKGHISNIQKSLPHKSTIRSIVIILNMTYYDQMVPNWVFYDQMITNRAFFDQMAPGCCYLLSKAETVQCSICSTTRRPCYLTSRPCAPCPGLICRFNHNILKASAPCVLSRYAGNHKTQPHLLTLYPLSWPDLQIILRLNQTENTKES